MSDEAVTDPDVTRPEPVRRGGRERPVQNAADAQSVKAQEKAIQKAEEQAMNDLRFLMARPEFQRFSRRLLQKTGYFARPRVLNAESHVLQGRAEIGLEVLLEMKDANPDGANALIAAVMTEEP